MISYSTSPLKIYTPPNTTQPPTCRATLLFLSLPVFVSLSLSPCLLSAFLTISRFPLRLAQDRLINQAVCRDFSSDARLLPNLVDDGFENRFFLTPFAPLREILRLGCGPAALVLCGVPCYLCFPARR